MGAKARLAIAISDPTTAFFIPNPLRATAAAARRRRSVIGEFLSHSRGP
jgi:hypothetical protein